MRQEKTVGYCILTTVCGLVLAFGGPSAGVGAPPEHAQKKSGSSGKKGPKSTNTAPTISGTPATSVLQERNYGFSPSAGDADDDLLAFSIKNLPPWATFNMATGALIGFPDASDIGTYRDIVIAVTDGLATTSLPAFSVEVLPYALGSVTVSWLPPTANEDGTALLDLAGYRIYWGLESRNYQHSVDVTNSGITTFVVDNLTSGAYYFGATAINSRGMESEFSVEAATTVP